MTAAERAAGFLARWALALAVLDRALTVASVLGGGALLTVGAAKVYPPAGYLVSGGLLLAAGIRAARR